MKIGILGFQGAVIEHQRHIEQLGQEAVVVRYTEQLAEIDGIILPGGESTTMGKLLNRTGMMEPFREKIQQGMPVWGTCAGMILLAKELDQDPVVHLGMMDITVRRNAYGTQIDSFDTQVVIPEVSDEQIPLVFIRAPYIVRTGERSSLLDILETKSICFCYKFSIQLFTWCYKWDIADRTILGIFDRICVEIR